MGREVRGEGKFANSLGGFLPLATSPAPLASSERLISHRLIEPSQHRGGQRKLRLHLDARRH